MDIVIPDKLQKQVLEIIKVKFNYPGGGIALTYGNTLIGDASNVAQPIPLNAMPYPITLIPTINGDVDGVTGDHTNRITLKSYQQSSQSKPYGDLLRFVPQHGRAKSGAKFLFSGDSAFVVCANAAPYNIVNGDTFKWKVDGGAEQTYTFTTGFTSGAATADEVSNLICIYIGSHQQNAQMIENFLTNTSSLRLSSDVFGSSSTIQVTGGTANTAFGFATTVVNGVNGFDQGDGTIAIPKAWWVCHDKPNDYGSNNKHSHISLEVVDSNGDMQTRMGVEYGLDTTNITVSSARFIVNENPIISSGSVGSNKELWFSYRNTGQQNSRLQLIRCEATTGDLKFIVVNDAGVTDTVLILDRLLSRVRADASIQFRQGSSVARSTTLNPLCAGGNYFVVTGTGTASYMRIDTWQAGSEVTLELPTGVVLGHNTAGSTPGTSVPFFLSGSAAFTVGANGATIKLAYNGTAWMEVCRTSF